MRFSCSSSQSITDWSACKRLPRLAALTARLPPFTPFMRTSMILRSAAARMGWMAESE